MRKISRVGIDLDGVVADYLQGVIPLMKEYYGLDPDFNRTAYSIEELFGITSENRPQGMRKVLYEELHLFRSLPKLEKNIEQLTVLLKDAEKKVYFMTARGGSHVVREDTIYWLTSRGFQFDDVFHTKDKAEFCKQARIHVMYEDEIGQLLSLQAAGIDTVIRNQPWNIDLPEDPNLLTRKKGKQFRVNNWQEAYNQIREYLE